jgi:hypothetical protein
VIGQPQDATAEGIDLRSRLDEQLQKAREKAGTLLTVAGAETTEK